MTIGCHPSSRATRLLLIGINYKPELTGIGKYTGEMSEWLAAHGVEVSVVTTPPYYPQWQVDPKYSARRYRSERINGVRVIRCPLWVPRRVTGLKRLFHLASFAITALPVALWLGWRWRPDAVFVIEPPLLAAPAALIAARMAKAEAWLHVQDLEVDAAFDLGILRSSTARRLVLALERWLLGRFDKVSTISNRMLARLEEKNGQGRYVLFPNWVELDRIFPLPVSELKAHYFPQATVVVLYSGNMGEKQGLEVLLGAAKLVYSKRSDKIQFLLCGDGAARERLERAASGIPNITFTQLVPHDSLNDFLNVADVHVLPQREGAEDLVLPSKLTNMLASGRPVVATVRPDTQVAEIIGDCGITVPPNDPDRLAEAICELADNPERRRSLGVTARKVAERLWNKEVILSSVFSEWTKRNALVSVGCETETDRLKRSA